jgi:hypothetical protein
MADAQHTATGSRTGLTVDSALRCRVVVDAEMNMKYLPEKSFGFAKWHWPVREGKGFYALYSESQEDAENKIAIYGFAWLCDSVQCSAEMNVTSGDFDVV